MTKKVRLREALSRRQQRDLDIEIGFLEGVVRRDPGYEEALQVLGDDYSKRGRFDEGLRVDEQLAGLRKQDCYAHYNLACSYTRTGKTELAFTALEQALELGYRDFKWLSRDPDLRPLRKLPAYRRIRARIKAMQIRVE